MVVSQEGNNKFTETISELIILHEEYLRRLYWSRHQHCGTFFGAYSNKRFEKLIGNMSLLGKKNQILYQNA